jgi:mono/diheme cytochrome c family protein
MRFLGAPNLSNEAYGRVPELSSTELLRTPLHKGGFSLKDAIIIGQSVDAALSNLYTSREDRKRGGQIFGARCAECHGPDGEVRAGLILHSSP